MSREIKFRAWDKAYKVMVCRDDNASLLAQWLETPEIFEAMQYTGLTDKNGVEIYEGDILCYEGFTGVVEYDAPEFIVNDMIWAMESCEVIGNIYENPELLEKAA